MWWSKIQILCLFSHVFTLEPKPQHTRIILSPEDADQLLQQPVRSKETVIGAMTAAASITPKAIQNLSVEAAMESYPYLKQTDLVRLHLFEDKIYQEFKINLTSQCLCF